MDTKLLPHRLKSARRKKRIQKEDLDKQLLKLDRERDHIWDNPNRVIVVPLEEPYQRGWKRLFVWNAAIQRSEQAEFYQQILDQVNTVQYHYDPSFRKTKRKQYQHKYNYDLPKLQTINRRDWHLNKAQLTEAQRECFNRIDYWDNRYYCWTYKYEFAFTHLLKIAVQPHIVTTIKLRDVQIEQRIKYIDDYLVKSGLNYRLTKLKGKSYRYRGDKMFEKAKYINPLKNKAIWDWED